MPAVGQHRRGEIARLEDGEKDKDDVGGRTADRKRYPEVEVCVGCDLSISRQLSSLPAK